MKTLNPDFNIMFFSMAQSLKEEDYHATERLWVRYSNRGLEDINPVLFGMIPLEEPSDASRKHNQ